MAPSRGARFDAGRALGPVTKAASLGRAAGSDSGLGRPGERRQVDLEEGDDGTFRIARRVAPNRVISTVDPDARHGHKTEARGFDGYKGHLALDPDAELITATAVTTGNAGDGSAAPELLEAELSATTAETPDDRVLTVYGDAAYGTGELLATSRTSER